jgi:hypothetical protein
MRKPYKLLISFAELIFWLNKFIIKKNVYYILERALIALYKNQLGQKGVRQIAPAKPFPP